LVLLVLFFIWNLRIVAGLQLSKALPAPPKPSPQPASPAHNDAAPRVFEPVVEHQAEAAQDQRQQPPPVAPAQPVPEETQQGCSRDGRPQAHEELVQQLAELPWPALLRRRAGWCFNRVQGLLVDAEGQAYELVGVAARGHRADLRFRRAFGEGLKPKQVSLALAATQAEPVRLALAQQSALPCPGQSRPRCRPLVEPARWVRQLSATPSPPLYALHWPLFTATAARDVFLAAVDEMEVRIVPAKRPPPDKGHPLVAASRAHRQHRRKTYEERLEAHRGLPPEEFEITVSSPLMRRWLTGKPRRHQLQTLQI
jgi:hypothetical protein